MFLAFSLVLTQCFLSLFWVWKWHPKILQWHPKFWKPRYGFALYWSKTIWRKHVFLHVAIATDRFNVIIGRHIFLAQKLEAKIVKAWCLCIVMRTASLPPLTVADLYSMLYETAKALSCNCGSVLLFHRCHRLAWQCIMHQTTTKTKGRQFQRACKTRWLWSEATVRARSEIFAVWAALKQVSENINDAMCVVLLRLMKTKNFNLVLSFCQHWQFTWQNWTKISGGMFWLCTGKSFGRTVHQ